MTTSIRIRRRRNSRSVLIGLLLATTAAPGMTEEAPQASDQAPGSDSATIVVVGNRLVADIPAERSLDRELAESYGYSTIGELLGAIRAETGEDDDDPILLINGQRVNDLGDIEDYPVEAIERLDILPRGTGVRVGASAQRRVYSVVLRKEVRSLALTAAHRLATDGGWSSNRGEAILTRIQGPNRINLTLRVRGEDELLESDRGLIQPEPSSPFDFRGNIVSDPRLLPGEIDPLLSALAGQIVLRAAVPARAHPTLQDFAAMANTDYITDIGRFRSLRPETTDYNLSLSVGHRLAPWLMSTATMRIDYAENDSQFGLARGVFIVPVANPFSPFSRDVGLALYRDGESLKQHYTSFASNVAASLNADLGSSWSASLSSNYTRGDRRYATDRQSAAQLFGPILLDQARDPFDPSLGDLLLVGRETSRSLQQSGGGQLTITGSPISLPAGKVRISAGASILSSNLSARRASSDFASMTEFQRTESSLFVGSEIPLASRSAPFLPGIGDLSATLEYTRADVSAVGVLERHAYGISWTPLAWLRIFAGNNVTRRPADVQTVADAAVVTPGVRYFDIVQGKTVDVTQISGGNPLLLPERIEARRLSINAAPMASINLQLNAEYSSTTNRNFVSSLPPASQAILLAFPERFPRDANGNLVSVDVRPVNYARQRQEQVRYGFSFVVPIGPPPAPTSPVEGGHASSDGGEFDGAASAGATAPPLTSGPRTRLQVSAYHTIVLNNDIVIRPALPTVDLLSGGAIGLGGGTPRYLLDLSLTGSARGAGLRLSGTWRSESLLDTGTAGSSSLLRFSPIATVNLQAFVDGRRLFPDQSWLRGSRITLSVVNLSNERQTVRDASGFTPLRYQPGYRDALGRTVEIALRKVF